MDQQLTSVTKNYVNVKAKKLKPGDHIFLGGRSVSVVETKKNAFGQINLSFKSWVGGQTYGVLIVNKNFPFNVRRVEHLKKK